MGGNARVLIEPAPSLDTNSVVVRLGHMEVPRSSIAEEVSDLALHLCVKVTDSEENWGLSGLLSQEPATRKAAIEEYVSTDGSRERPRLSYAPLFAFDLADLSTRDFAGSFVSTAKVATVEEKLQQGLDLDENDTFAAGNLLELVQGAFFGETFLVHPDRLDAEIFEAIKRALTQKGDNWAPTQWTTGSVRLVMFFDHFALASPQSILSAVLKDTSESLILSPLKIIFELPLPPPVSIFQGSDGENTFLWLQAVKNESGVVTHLLINGAHQSEFENHNFVMRIGATPGHKIQIPEDLPTSLRIKPPGRTMGENR